MALFTIYDPASGRILCSGSCPDHQVTAQLANYPGGVVIREESSPSAQYVKEGVIVDMPERPSMHHRWNHAAEAWEESRPPTEVIKTRRDQAIGSGIVVGGLQIATDEVSQQRIMGAAVSAMLDPQYAVQWKVSETAFVTLTAPEIIQIAQLVRAHVQACFDNEAALLGLVASDLPYDVETGWP